MLDTKLRRQEIVCYATEDIGWEEKSLLTYPERQISLLRNTQTGKEARLEINPGKVMDEYIYLTVNGTLVYQGFLSHLQDF